MILLRYTNEKQKQIEVQIMNANNRITELREEIEQINDDINNIVNSLGYYAESFFNENRDYLVNYNLDDRLQEEADSLVGIYYSDLYKWLIDYSNAEEYIQRSHEELGTDANTDLPGAIRCAQYMYYIDQLYADYDKLKEIKGLLQELAELKREQVA